MCLQMRSMIEAASHSEGTCMVFLLCGFAYEHHTISFGAEILVTFTAWKDFSL